MRADRLRKEDSLRLADFDWKEYRDLWKTVVARSADRIGLWGPLPGEREGKLRAMMRDMETPKYTEEQKFRVALRARVIREGRLITSETIETLVDRIYPGMIVVTLDKVFRAVSRETARDLLFHDITDRNKYISEFNDCDDFSLELKVGLQRFGYTAVGAVTDTSGKHAYNMLIIKDNEGLSSILVEPQNDKHIQLDGRQYNMKFGWIRF